jgi:hypothetical protein
MSATAFAPAFCVNTGPIATVRVWPLLVTHKKLTDLNVELDPKERADSLYLRIQANRCTRRVRNRPLFSTKGVSLIKEPKLFAGASYLSVFDDLDVSTSRGQAQLAQIALEVAVHFGCVVSLALGLLDVQGRLLGNIQRDICGEYAEQTYELVVA